MKHIPTSVVAVACSLTWALPSPAHDVASQIMGVWRVKSVESLDVESKEVRRPFGDSPLSFFVFSRGGRFLKGNSYGNYKVEGSKVTIAYDRSTTMQDIGETTLVREVEVKGNVMTLKSTPIVNRMIGKTLVEVDLLEGQRRTMTLLVAALVEDFFGIQGMMDLESLARLMREAPAAWGYSGSRSRTTGH